jgi:hypothetical protein
MHETAGPPAIPSTTCGIAHPLSPFTPTMEMPAPKPKRNHPDAPWLNTCTKNFDTHPARDAGVAKSTRRTAAQMEEARLADEQQEAKAQQQKERALARVTAIEDEQRSHDQTYAEAANHPVDPPRPVTRPIRKESASTSQDKGISHFRSPPLVSNTLKLQARGMKTPVLVAMDLSLTPPAEKNWTRATSQVTKTMRSAVSSPKPAAKMLWQCAALKMFPVISRPCNRGNRIDWGQSRLKMGEMISREINQV